MKLVSTTLFCLALAVSLALPGAAAAQGCVPFQGIDHCPVGDATLEALPDGGGLLVSGLGPAANDGVASRFAPTTLWNAQLEFPEGTSMNRTVNLSSISGGEVTSELLIQATDGRYQLGASFTGSADESTYAVLVYRQGILQGGVGGFSSGLTSSGATETRRSPQSSLSTINDRYCTECQPTVEVNAPDELPNWWWDYIFGRYGHGFQIRGDGGCSWSMGFRGDVLVTLADGSEFVGDEIRFDEEVHGPGHYPYLGFESIEIESSTGSVTILDELAQGAE